MTLHRSWMHFHQRRGTPSLHEQRGLHDSADLTRANQYSLNQIAQGNLHWHGLKDAGQFTLALIISDSCV
jgi:hypothetical protein